MATAAISGTRYKLTGSGLNEGDQYAASIVYDPDDGSNGSNGRETLVSALPVLRGGRVKIVQSVAFVTGGNRKPGTLKGWLRAPDSAFNGDPVGSAATIRVND
jgi:hypothetical protein